MRKFTGLAIAAVVAAAGATVMLWDRKQRRRGSLTGHTGAVRCAALADDAAIVVTGGADRTVRMWAQ
jgi:WD40 repeat protein